MGIWLSLCRFEHWKMFHFQFGFKSATEWVLNGKQALLRALDLETVIHQSMGLDLRNITRLLLLYILFSCITPCSHMHALDSPILWFSMGLKVFCTEKCFLWRVCTFEQGGIKPKAMKIYYVSSCTKMVWMSEWQSILHWVDVRYVNKCPTVASLLQKVTQNMSVKVWYLLLCSHTGQRRADSWP